MTSKSVYLVEVQDRSLHYAHPKQTVVSESFDTVSGAKERAFELRAAYPGGRFTVTFQTDDTGAFADSRTKRWIHVVTQDLGADFTRFVCEQKTGRKATFLPESMGTLSKARKFFWPLVRAKSRRERKRLAGNLAAAFIGAVREVFAKEWERSPYSGAYSLLDAKHRVHRDKSFFKKPVASFIFFDEDADYGVPVGEVMVLGEVSQSVYGFRKANATVTNRF